MSFGCCKNRRSSLQDLRSPEKKLRLGREDVMSWPRHGRYIFIEVSDALARVSRLRLAGFGIFSCVTGARARTQSENRRSCDHTQVQRAGRNSTKLTSRI